MRAVATALLTAALITLGVVAPASASTYPTSPVGDPPGANDWSCRPTAAHPEPVVLVHGTFGDRASLLQPLSAAVKAAGYCVFSLDYGNRATGDIPTSARQLSAYVDHVLAATGASKVSMVGHSQGGMMPRYYLEFLGGASKVDDLVGLVPSNHGTTTPLASASAPLCPACAQQAAGSAFLRQLNAGDKTPGDVSYTVVTTRYDEVVTPYTSAYLAGANTTNITLQDLCPTHAPDHLFLPTDPAAIQIVLNALGRSGPADPAFRPAC